MYGMRMPRSVLCAVMAALLLAGAGAQALTRSSARPLQDGNLAAGEYGFTKAVGGMGLGLSLSEDGSTLYVALEAPGRGWVSVGLGSQAMVKAYMVFGYAKEGKAYLSEQLGAGHGHSPVASPRTTKCECRELGDKTTLEFAIPAKDYLGPGGLELILAYSRSGDDFTSRHAGRTGLLVPLK